MTLADIYLTVVPEPTDAFITQRQRVISAVTQSDDFWAHFPTWIELVWAGFPSKRLEPFEKGVKAIIQAIQAEQPSFPSDPEERGLDLRVTAAAILRAYLCPPAEAIDDTGSCVPALIIAASSLHPLEGEPAFARLADRVRRDAVTLLDAKASSVRTRPDVALPTIEGNNLQSIAHSLDAAVDALREALEARERVDREELQVLWWIFGRHSTLLDRHYEEMNAGDAALAAGCELAEIMLLPPVGAATAFLRSILPATNRQSLKRLADQLSSRAMTIVQPPSIAQPIVRDHPTLCPITWLSARLVESDRSPWEEEFEKKTGLSVALEKTPSEWAEQVFAERVACLLLAKELEPEGD